MSARIYKLLTGPEAVVYFQQICGIYPAADNDGFHQIQTDDKTSYTRKGIHNNNGTSSLNGSSGNCYELRSRKVDHQIETGEGKNEEHSSSCVDQENRYNNTSNKSVKNDCEFLIKQSFFHYLLYYIFTLGANLGNEAFYSSFFPFWFWNIDGYVFRRFALIWFVTLYCGQVLKDIICWPRPPSPPVIRMEKQYELEHGMPSTHAIVGFTIPFTLLFLTTDRYEYDFYKGLAFCVCWTAVVCLSRIYLGMHTILDVICGLLGSILILPVLLPHVDVVDEFILTNHYAPFVIVAMALLLCMIYPPLDKWTGTRGDTISLVSVYMGIALGSWTNYQLGIYSTTPSESPPYSITLPDATWCAMALLRTFIGVIFLISSRVIMKTLTLTVLCAILKLDIDDPKTKQHKFVELPYKLITYTVITFNVACLVPCLFQYLGIARTSFYSER